MTRKHIAFALLVISISTTNSYGKVTSSNITDGFSPIYIGADLSYIPFSSGISKTCYETELRFSNPLQFSSGLNLNMRVKNRLNSYTIFKTGIQFDVLNNNVHLSRCTDDERIEQADLLFRKQYIGIPILWGYSAHLTNNKCFVIRMGFVTFIEIGNKFSYTSIGDWKPSVVGWRNTFNKEKGWNATTLHLSYGYERMLSKTTLIQYEIYWQHRFNQEGFYNEQTHRPFRHYDIFGIGIGLGWNPCKQTIRKE